MISLMFRIALICGSLITAGYMVKKIRQSKLQIEYSIFWMLFAASLVILSIFPEITIYGASLLGIYSSTNFIFLLIFTMPSSLINLRILKVFLMTIELSTLEYRVKELAQKLAISEKIEQDKKNAEKEKTENE